MNQREVTLTTFLTFYWHKKCPYLLYQAQSAVCECTSVWRALLGTSTASNQDKRVPSKMISIQYYDKSRSRCCWCQSFLLGLQQLSIFEEEGDERRSIIYKSFNTCICSSQVKPVSIVGRTIWFHSMQSTSHCLSVGERCTARAYGNCFVAHYHDVLVLVTVFIGNHGNT